MAKTLVTCSFSNNDKRIFQTSGTGVSKITRSVIRSDNANPEVIGSPLIQYMATVLWDVQYAQGRLPHWNMKANTNDIVHKIVMTWRTKV